MAPNITTGSSFLTVVAPRTVRVFGNVLLPGEIDGRQILNNATQIDKIYVKRNGALRVFKPNSIFSQIDTLEPGEGVLVGALTNIESELFFPLPTSSKNIQALNSIATILDPPTLDLNIANELPNLPTAKRSAMAIALERSATNNPWNPQQALTSLGFMRVWISCESAASDGVTGDRISTIGSWGASTSGLNQLVPLNRPYLTPQGLEFSINPARWMSYDGQFLSATNFTVFILERREATNAGYILGGSSAANNANLRVGYSSPTTFSFNRLGGTDLNYTVPSTLSTDFVLWACKFDGVKRSLYRNGVKVAEVNDTIPLGSYDDASIGHESSNGSYIGTIRFYVASVSALTDLQIQQITSVLQEYAALYPQSNNQLSEGTITLTQPTTNSTIPVNDQGLGEILINGSYTLEDLSPPVSAIEAQFGSSGWTTIVSRPEDKIFSYIFARGAGTGDLTVRFKDNPAVATTIANITILDARPGNVQGSADTVAKSITATWAAPNGVTVNSYDVRWTKDNGATFSNPPASVAGNTLTHTFPSLLPGNYLVEVRSILATGASTYIRSTAVAELPPTPPATLTANLLSAATSILRFNGSISDAKSYGVFNTTGTPIWESTALTTGDTGCVAFDGNFYFRETDETRYRWNGVRTLFFSIQNTNPVTTNRTETILSKWQNVAGLRSHEIRVEYSTTFGQRIIMDTSSTGNASTLIHRSPYYPAASVLTCLIQFNPSNYIRIKVNNASSWTSVAIGGFKTATVPLTIGGRLESDGSHISKFTGKLGFFYHFESLTNDEENIHLFTGNNGAPLLL